ncbi:collagen-like protein [Reyranella massiliensis]|uniref:collagen-like protein n=1 Tax=Reyranella massiliensis TaxID=445220 RepID=UPI0006847ED5|nr:collagen-like protein [Reyranella massiliensis]
MPLPDALREALGQVIADQRREWRREREVIEAQSRQLQADAQRTIAELRAQIVELQAELRAKVDARLAELRDGTPGERGEPGPVGPQGEMGPAGPQGERGLRGEQGEAGPQGERGEQGPQGVAGDRGPAGEAGPQGERGGVGPAGPQGERGEIGPQGERGDVGPAGIQGPVGERGEQGPAGERGVEGAPGKLPPVGSWEDHVHREADVVTHAGAVYQALRDTGKAPPHDDWRCIVPAALDGRSINLRSTWSADETYARLDVVTLDGGAFVARRDDPGPCPGEGWMLLVMRGKAGKPGIPGPRGERGARGEPGPAVTGIAIDETGMVTLSNADGSAVEHDFAPVLSRLMR